MSNDAVDVIIYDGVCGLCDRFVAYVLARDRHARFRFAPQQEPWAQAALAQRGRREIAGSTVVVLTGDGRVLERSAAVFHVLGRLGGAARGWTALRALPRRITDWGYDQVARRRYRIFGRRDTCRVPTAQERARFLIAEDDAGAAERTDAAR